MKKVFLWYPRRVWKMEGDEAVNTFSWMTWANDYTPPLDILNRLRSFARRHFLKQRLRKYFPKLVPKFFPITLPIPQFNPNAHAEFLEKWPTAEDFIRDQRPICNDARMKYTQLLLMTMIRRVMPTLIAQDLVSVQPMTGPVGQIFTMRYKYGESNQ